jgi:hypothetical protein
MLEASRKEIYYIYMISNPMHNKEGVLKGVEDIMNTILADSKPPFRIVSRLIPEIITDEQTAANKNRKYIHFSLSRYITLSLSSKQN